MNWYRVENKIKLDLEDVTLSVNLNQVKNEDDIEFFMNVCSNKYLLSDQDLRDLRIVLTALLSNNLDYVKAAG